jgi:uncharacterized protein YbdZ (MbtH family)
MTKTEAIQVAKQSLAETGLTQFIMRRGDKYEVFPSDKPTPSGWKTAEMISKGNVHAY